MTQKELILKLIQASGTRGISTNELRNETHAVDVPKCVSDLKKDGYKISSTENGDGTVTYYMEEQEIRLWLETPTGYQWVSKGVQKVKAKPRKKKSHIEADWKQIYTVTDPLTGKTVDFAH